MTTRAVYPGTFDPITNGHLDLIQRAAKLFDEIIIAVAATSRKNPAFDFADRLGMCEQVLGDIKGVQVQKCSGLLVDFMHQHQATIIIRGLRAVSDFDYEFQLAGMNRQMSSDIDTIFLPASGEHAYVSSTMVREIVSLGGDPSPFVPDAVRQFLDK